MVDPVRFAQLFGNLRQRGKNDAGTWRVAWTDEDWNTRYWFEQTCRELGFEAYTDAAGNVWALWNGCSPDDPGYVIMGSHLDTVPAGGDFDGAYGVVGGLEVLLSIRDYCTKYGVKPRYNLGVVGFEDEEGVTFGNSLFGSRAVMHEWRPDDLRQLASVDDRPFTDAAQQYGVTLDRIMAVQPPNIVQYIELHIEQGPVLWDKGIPIGVVSVVAGRQQGYVRFRGKKNHAGTTPMDQRQDALLFAADAIARLNAAAKRHHGVGTVGELKVSPGSPNVIPESVVASFDIRAPEDADREAMFQAWSEGLLEGNVQFSHKEASVPMDASIQQTIRESAESLRYPTLAMPSWAIHDAMIMARHVPTGMIFVPSAVGVSHAKDEFTNPADCVRGVEVLHETVQRLVLPGGAHHD